MRPRGAPPCGLNPPPPPTPKASWNIPSVIMRGSLLSIDLNPDPSLSYPLPLEYSLLNYRGGRLCLSQPNSNRSRSIAYPRILRELRVKPFSLTHLIAAPTPQKGKPPMPNPPPTRHRPPRSCRVRTADQITHRGPPCGPYVQSKCTENE